MVIFSVLLVKLALLALATASYAPVQETTVRSVLTETFYQEETAIKYVLPNAPPAKVLQATIVSHAFRDTTSQGETLALFVMFSAANVQAPHPLIA